MQPYVEKQSEPIWLQILCFATLTYVGIANLAWPLLADLNSARNHLLYWSLVLPAFVLFGLLPVSFRSMTIEVDDEALRVKWGIVRRSFPLTRVQAIRPSSARPSWRFPFRQRGWSIMGVRGGAEFTLAQGDRKQSYFVSSLCPDLFVSAVRDRTGLPSVDTR